MPTQAEIDALRYREPDWLAKALYKPKAEEKKPEKKKKGWRKKEEKRPQGKNQDALNIHEKANTMVEARKL
jgi:hypothetical protein